MDNVINRFTVYEDGTIEAHEPPPPPPEPPQYTIGLDLGQRADYTALTILEDHGPGSEIHCRHATRYKLNTPYPAIVDDVREICMREPLLSNEPRLVLDETGVGIAITDLFMRAIPRINAGIVPITITGGTEVNSEGRGYRVPKRELVSIVQACLQTSRLKVAAELPAANTLLTELLAFQITVSEAGHDSYNGRVGVHDDMVLSLALALWYSQKARRWMIMY